MTTLAALFAALPLMLGLGRGDRSCADRSGVSIFGGLIVSQALTLFTTPVIYLWFERLGKRFGIGQNLRKGEADPRLDEAQHGRRAGGMNLSGPFVRRPIGTVLLTIGLALAGIGAFFNLPGLTRCRRVDSPTISVQAQLPGASPETMATSVATPLERHLGLIAELTEMTSSSRVGTTNITLQFDLSRNIDGAARDVQAAINAARIDLPATLKTNPTYRKVNPADAPILVLALTSPTKTPGQIYDTASNIVQQQLSQVKGSWATSRWAAPRCRRCGLELNPTQLAHYGIAWRTFAPRSASANANRPKGMIDDGALRLQVYTNDAGTKAADYAPLLVAYRNGSAVRLSDIAAVNDSVEDVHNLGLFVHKEGGKTVTSQAVIVTVSRQPGANIISTVDQVKARLPAVQEALPQDIKMSVAVDRTNTIRSSLSDVERTVVIAIALVVAVVAFFLMNGKAILIPSVAVTVSLLGTLGGDVPAGLLARQPVADGPDHLDRLRGRRRHRGAGERHPARRGGPGPVRGRAERRAGGGLHRALDQHLANRGVHPDPADGRHLWPHLPRVRDHPIGRRADLAGGRR